MINIEIRKLATAIMTTNKLCAYATDETLVVYNSIVVNEIHRVFWQKNARE